MWWFKAEIMGVEAFVVRVTVENSAPLDSIEEFLYTSTVEETTVEVKKWDDIDRKGEYSIFLLKKEAIQVRVVSSSFLIESEIYLRFSYCCPDCVDDLFKKIVCGIMKGFSGQMTGCYIAMLIHSPMVSCRDFVETFEAQMPSLRNGWFELVSSRERLVLPPEAVWSWFDF